MAPNPHLDANYINVMILTSRELGNHFRTRQEPLTPEELVAASNITYRFGALLAVLALELGIITGLPEGFEYASPESLRPAGPAEGRDAGPDQESVPQEG